ncbi:collagen-like protein, partial [Nodularia sp. UHCC 0506]
MSSCDQISSEIAALSAAIAALDGKYVLKSERPQIVRQSIAGAESLIMPRTEQLIAAAIAGLAAKILGIEVIAKGAAAAAASAAGVAAAAAAKVATLAAAIAGILASIAALKILGARIDSVERGLSFLSNDVSRTLGLIPPIRDTANRALATAQSIPAGRQGERGLTGATGATGARGERGLTGATGARG